MSSVATPKEILAAQDAVKSALEEATKELQEAVESSRKKFFERTGLELFFHRNSDGDAGYVVNWESA